MTKEGGCFHESETICEADLRKMQDYQKGWQGYGNLQQPKA
jgi:hypothetical protein